ncbi:hypothetical protein JXB22_10550 [candidate division WOR-3 bacterium]|nr:hypothetical protein [candidate division WOR-3 bacterium]
MKTMIQRSMVFLLFGVIFCLIACIHYSKYTPDPEKDIELWVANFSYQRSFSYRYTMKTATVRAQGQGECVIDRGEHIHGTWEQAGQVLPFEYFGIRDREYSKQDDQWVSALRGEQSDILTQVERLLQFDEFEYQGADRVYTYRFKANIPFLAPGRWKEMIGVMEMSKRTFLPIRIWAGLPDSSVSWTIELFDYNKKKSIDAPRMPWHSFHIQGEHANLDRSIKDRLHAAEIEHRLEPYADGFLLHVPEYYTLEDIEVFLADHTITGYRLTREKEQAIMIGYLRNDKNIPIFCAETLFTHMDIKNMSIKIDPAYRPLLFITLKQKKHFPSEIAVAVDGVIQQLGVLDSDEKISTLQVYTTMHYCELQLLQAAVLYTLPELEVKTFSGESP